MPPSVVAAAAPVDEPHIAGAADGHGLCDHQAVAERQPERDGLTEQRDVIPCALIYTLHTNIGMEYALHRGMVGLSGIVLFFATNSRSSLPAGPAYNRGPRRGKARSQSLCAPDQVP